MMIEGPSWDEPTLLLEEEPPGAFPDGALDMLSGGAAEERAPAERRAEG